MISAPLIPGGSVEGTDGLCEEDYTQQSLLEVNRRSWQNDSRKQHSIITCMDQTQETSGQLEEYANEKLGKRTALNSAGARHLYSEQRMERDELLQRTD